MNYLESLIILIICSILFSICTIKSRLESALNGEPFSSISIEETSIRISEYFNTKFIKCTLKNEDYIDSLTKAITSVEYTSMSLFEVVTEDNYLKLSKFLGWSIADISFGPSQIKPSTVINTIKYFNGNFITSSNEDIIDDLIDDCKNVELANNYITYLTDKYNVKNADDLVGIMNVISEYNGQVTRNLENLTYRSIVYKTYTIYNDKRRDIRSNIQ